MCSIVRRVPRLILGGLIALGSVAVACGGDESGGRGHLRVFAAASLTEAFEKLGTAFAAENPNVKVTFNFAASSALVRQIGEGAPADVFASADLANMDTLTAAGHTRSAPVVFTTNRAQIIVEHGNPKGIAGIADLARGDLLVVSCAPEVPCGRYAKQILDKAAVTVSFKSLEKNVKAVVSKVTLGEADAGIVYRTDVLAAGAKAAGVDIPADLNVVAEYPITITKEAKDPQAAQAFIDFIRSTAGAKILESFGFVSP